MTAPESSPKPAERDVPSEAIALSPLMRHLREVLADDSAFEAAKEEARIILDAAAIQRSDGQSDVTVSEAPNTALIQALKDSNIVFMDVLRTGSITGDLSTGETWPHEPDMPRLSNQLRINTQLIDNMAAAKPNETSGATPVYETHYDGSDQPSWVTRVKHGPYVAYHYVREAADQLTNMLNAVRKSAGAEGADYSTLAKRILSCGRISDNYPSAPKRTEAVISEIIESAFKQFGGVNDPDLKRFEQWAREMDFPVSTWTVSDVCTFFGFFKHGWRCRGMDDAAAKSTPGVDEWQDIETAPKDQTRILCSYRGNRPFIARWRNDFSVFMDDWDSWRDATHWMPLPRPIAVNREADQEQIGGAT